jgi:hypothetical protein
VSNLKSELDNGLSAHTRSQLERRIEITPKKVFLFALYRTPDNEILERMNVAQTKEQINKPASST